MRESCVTGCKSILMALLFLALDVTVANLKAYLRSGNPKVISTAKFAAILAKELKMIERPKKAVL